MAHPTPEHSADYVAGLERFVRGRIESHFGTPLEYITASEQERWVLWMAHDLDGSRDEVMRSALRRTLQIDGHVCRPDYQNGVCFDCGEPARYDGSGCGQ